MKSSVSARLVERADKRRGMTLLELKAFVTSCEEQGIPDHATLKVNVGMRRQLHELVATVPAEESGLVHETQQLLERAPRTWVLADNLDAARRACELHGIAYVHGMPVNTRVCAITVERERDLRNASIRPGDKLLQLRAANDTTVAEFERALVRSGLTYADVEILL